MAMIKFKIGTFLRPWQIQELLEKSEKEPLINRETINMGLMKSWEKWSRRIYVKYKVEDLQAKYDKLAKMKLPKSVVKAFDKLEKVLSPKIVEQFVKWVMKSKAVTEEYKGKSAEDVLTDVLKKIKDAI